jgi:hypothetical protein
MIIMVSKCEEVTAPPPTDLFKNVSKLSLTFSPRSSTTTGVFASRFPLAFVVLRLEGPAASSCVGSEPTSSTASASAVPFAGRVLLGCDDCETGGALLGGSEDRENTGDELRSMSKIWMWMPYAWICGGR